MGRSGVKKQWWERTLGFFWEHVVPELVFAVLTLGALALGRLLGLKADFLDAIGVIAVLLLGAEVLIRWRLYPMDKRLESLTSAIRKYGLAVTDHTRLGGLATSYLDERAGALASCQRELSAHRTWRLPVRDVHNELIRITQLARSHCTEIRAVASRNLKDYVTNDEARDYFRENATTAKDVEIHRLFVLDKKYLEQRLVRELIHSQSRDFLGANPSDRGDPVRWVYRPVDDSDTAYPENRVPAEYAADWVLFGRSLLVKHDVSGEGWATVTVDPTTIDDIVEQFEQIWDRGMSPDKLPEEAGEGKPKNDVSRPVPRTRLRVVGVRAENVAPGDSEVA